MKWALLLGCFAALGGFYPALRGFDLSSLQGLLGLGISILGILIIFKSEEDEN